MAFCGNVLELVEKHKILDDKTEFVKWTDFEKRNDKVEVYIEKTIISELVNQDFLLIDAAIGELPDGEQFGMLFIKKDDSVYG
jgi:hypothetical protein